MTDDLSLGKLLGRREAFNIVAARCSAADAALLRQLREEKLYLNHSKDWGEFCAQHLHVSRENADRLIRLLDEFGPTYFEVAQLTRISPATYRAIAPSIRDQALHHNGDAIALIPENTEKVAAAVAEMRKAVKAPEPPPPPPEDRIARLERRCSELVKELEEAACWRARDQQVRAVVCYLRQRVERIEQTI